MAHEREWVNVPAVVDRRLLFSILYPLFLIPRPLSPHWLRTLCPGLLVDVLGLILIGGMLIFLLIIFL